MLGWIRRMTTRQLMYGWIGYWTAIAAATLWRPLGVAWRVSRPDAKGTISASIDNGVLNFKMLQDQAEVWSASVSSNALLFWLCAGPLAMWLVWVLLRPRRAGDPALGIVTPAPALGAAPQPVESFSPRRERTPVPITPLP